MPESRRTSRSLPPPLFSLLALIVLVAVLPAAVEATVTIRGTVQYWDSIDGRYRPAQNVFVEVEGDWYWRSDPEVETNRRGRYSARVEDPPWWWGGNYDGVDVEVYAETDQLLQIYEQIGSIFPYHVISNSRNNVEAGESVRIDVFIGGPRNNVEPGSLGLSVVQTTPTDDETANAFLVHQEMLDHRRDLMSGSFRGSDFEELEVIVPAAGVTSYYNHVTGYVNLVESDFTGTGGWSNLRAGPSGWDSSVDRFRYTVRHEYTHAIHDMVTGWSAPWGLNVPAEHHPEMEAGEDLAYTEGFAEFLPLAAFPSRAGGVFEPTVVDPNGSGTLRIEPSSPPLMVPHDGWEGEVAALFWDLYDEDGEEDRVRHPARRSEDDQPVPEAIVEGQGWVDRIEDSDLRRIRRIVSDGDIDTIHGFLDAYRRAYPDDLHALKAIARNRDIPLRGVGESHAHIDDEVDGFRIDGSVTLEFDVTEADEEDRRFVSVSFWRQQGSSAPDHVEDVDLSGGWTGENRAVRWQHSFSSVGADEAIWIVVSDEIFPTAYRVPMPENAISQAIRDATAPPSLPLPEGWESSAAAALTIQRQVREIVERTEREMRDWGERKSSVEKQRSFFERLAVEAGDLEREEARENRGDNESLRRWIEGVAAGRAEIRTEIPNEVLSEFLERIREAIAAQRAAREAAAGLRGSVGSIRTAAGADASEVLIEGLDRDARALADGLGELARDESTGAELDLHRAALERLLE